MKLTFKAYRQYQDMPSRENEVEITESSINQVDQMATNEISEIGIQILINEYNLSNERIEAFLNRQDTILQISMAILGGAIGFSILNDIPPKFYIMIPLIPIILFTHIMYHYTRVIANQGYREYLQIRLNKFLSRENRVYYITVGKEFLLRSNPMTKVNTTLFPSLIFLSILYSAIMSDFNILVVIADIMICFFVIRLVIIYFKFTSNLNDKVKEFCEKS